MLFWLFGAEHENEGPPDRPLQLALFRMGDTRLLTPSLLLTRCSAREGILPIFEGACSVISLPRRLQGDIDKETVDIQTF